MPWGPIKQSNRSIARFELCNGLFQPSHLVQNMMSQNHLKNQTDTSFYYCTSKTCSHNVWVGGATLSSKLFYFIFFHSFYFEPIRRPAETQQPHARTGRKNIAHQNRSRGCLSINLIIATIMFYLWLWILKKGETLLKETRSTLKKHNPFSSSFVFSKQIYWL